MVRPSGDTIYLRHLQEVTWNSHLSAWAKKSVSMESEEYFLNVEFVLGNIVRIDRMSSKYMMTMMSIISARDVIHKSLKKRQVISKPFVRVCSA